MLAMNTLKMLSLGTPHPSAKLCICVLMVVSTCQNCHHDTWLAAARNTLTSLCKMFS